MATTNTTGSASTYQSGQPSNGAGSSSLHKDDGFGHTPVCLVLGMAGSGKTTLVDALASYIEDENQITDALQSTTLQQSKQDDQQNQQEEEEEEESSTSTYILNLDPAVYELPYDPNIDIRDTINYKKVMKDYSLGPNGAIITSLNLYATRFDQVLSLLQQRANSVDTILIDTPGQIETFTWSASGSIITESVAMSLPTVILFVVDTQRCQNAMTFVSNMLYACSILYKTTLPMIIVFNKIDVIDCQFAQAWMEDFDAFDKALKEDHFVGTLARSLAMALEEFYNQISNVGVSASTGEGLEELMKIINEKAKEYEKEYKPIVQDLMKKKEKEEEHRIQNQVDQFRNDVDKEEEEEEERLRRMKGTYYDKDEEGKLYEQFLHRFEQSKKEQQG